MSDVRLYLFPPFRYEVRTQRLLKGSQQIYLRSKSRAVLLYLLEHPIRLVGKQEFFDGVWPKIWVSDAVLKISIQEIRLALEDNPKIPKFIETVRSTGYRFIHRVNLRNYRDEATQPERITGQFNRAALSASKTANLSLLIDQRKKSAYKAAAERYVSLLFRSLDGRQNSNHKLRFFLESAQRAIFRGAYIEAASYCTRALAMLSSVPESPQQTQLEVRLKLLVGLLFGAAGGGRTGDAFSGAEVLLGKLSTDSFHRQLVSELFFLIANF